MSTLKRAILFLFPYLILAVCILEERWRIQAASLMQYDTYTDMLTLTAVICTLFLFFYIRNIMEKYDGIVLLLNTIAVIVYTLLIWLPDVFAFLSPIAYSVFQNEQLFLTIIYGLLLIGEGYQISFFIKERRTDQGDSDS